MKNILIDILDNDDPILILEGMEIYLLDTIQSIINNNESEKDIHELYKIWQKDACYDLNGISEWLGVDDDKTIQKIHKLLNQLENCYVAINDTKKMKKDQETLKAIKITRDFIKERL